MHKLKRLLVKLRSFYQLDVRALGLMRIGVALVVLADITIRWQDIGAFFTDGGLWPTKLIPNFGWQPGFWSFHALSGSYGFATLLFCLHTGVALLLLVGYKTRLATLLVWIFTISLHNRNLFILQSGDDLLRITLFWALFLPWGNTLSLDAKKYISKPKHFSFASLGYLCLIASVYIFTVLLKNSSEWHGDASAVYYALSLDQLRLPVGDWLYMHPGLMQWLTKLVYITEILIPILILLPTKNKWIKLCSFTLILIMHIGIGTSLYVGLFYIINITTALAILPSEFLDRFKVLARSNFEKAKRKSFSVIKYGANAFSALVLALCLILNLSYMPWYSYELDKPIHVVVNTLRLNQFWGMFSPHIMKEDGWYLHEGYTAEGKLWDLYYNLPYIYSDKPKHLVKHFKSDRWRKLAENMQRNDYTFLRPLYCKYFLKKWNKEHLKNQMESLDLIFFQENNEADYRSKAINRKQYCFCTVHDE
ncbi:MAG: hypothetical protein SGJ15_10355 [Bacteroidota bacterium]|nr:hypothetical protein [Bacteroidota bacterium]